MDIFKREMTNAKTSGASFELFLRTNKARLMCTYGIKPDTPN